MQYVVSVCCMLKVGQNRTYAPNMIIYLVISMPKIHPIYMVLANPMYALWGLSKCPPIRQLRPANRRGLGIYFTNQGTCRFNATKTMKQFTSQINATKTMKPFTSQTKALAASVPPRPWSGVKSNCRGVNLWIRVQSYFVVRINTLRRVQSIHTFKRIAL